MTRFKSLMVIGAAVGLGFVGVSEADILITEVVDGDRVASDGSAGTSPDPFLAFVELTNTGGSAVDLSTFEFTNFNNGNTANTFASTPLTGILGAGETYYIAYEAAGSPNAFNSVYGFDANLYMGGKFTNGDDVYVLLDTPYVGGSGDLNTSTIVDVYGVLGTDGSGEAWEYTDAVAFRNPSVTSANPTFTTSEWTFGSLNETDGLNAAGYDTITTVIPEPASLALLGLGGLMIGLRRRQA